MRALIGLFLLFMGCTAGTDVERPTLGSSPLDPILVAEGPIAGAGVLYFVEERPQPWFRVLAYDITAASLYTVFDVPKGAFVLDIDVSPDGQTLAMSYITPDVEAGETDYQRAAIVLLDVQHPKGDAHVLTTLVCGERSGEICGKLTWTPDGQTLYFSRSLSQPAPGEPKLAVERYTPSTATRELIVAHGTEVALSADGTRMAYVEVDPITSERSLVVADADGREPERVVGFEEVVHIQHPEFSSEGWIFFAGTRPLTRNRRHGSHSTQIWWRVLPTHSAEAIAFSELRETIYGASLSPDGLLAYSSATGIALTSIAGAQAEPRQVVESRAIRALDWAR